MLSSIFFRTRYGLGFFLLLCCMQAWAVVGVPELSRRVIDLTATLSTEQVVALEDKLAAFEAQKGSQIAVLIVPSTQPKDIAEFGIEVADLSQIGRKGVDDGVIMIVAKDDRKLRLEVGYGLEGVIPDAVAKRVIEETITPYFKVGDYAGGIDAGVIRLMKLIEGEVLPPPPENQGDPQDEAAFMMTLFGGLIAGFVLSLIVGRLIGSMLAGLGSGMVAVLFFGLTLWLALFIGIMVFAIVGLLQVGGRDWSGGGYGGSRSGSSWSGDSGFGGSSGGSSWSGGGGDFGGGGASGSW
ncbi:TPM domain-containing protein [Methylobacter sp. Wu8]|uniref:TPM domain-containing protein n=1 Tax=Methylobacter sp. Wu8 TaxID=3118457 RepID=UPI002F2D3BEF